MYSHPIVGQIWSHIESELLARRPCYVCLFGPQGSGKSVLLDQLEMEAGNQKFPLRYVRVDLRNLSVCEPAVMFADLLKELSKAARTSGIDAGFILKPAANSNDLESLARTWLASMPVGYILLAFDHLDCVPRTFSRMLLRALRSFVDQTNVYPDFNRLGVLIAGAATLFAMREDLYSILVVSQRFKLPVLDQAIRRGLVTAYVQQHSIRHGPEVVDLLAEWTGGEVSFLKPVLNEFRSKYPNSGRVMTKQWLNRYFANLEIDSIGPQTRDLALWMLADEKLKEHAERLISADSPIPARRASNDIDLFQLHGAFIRVTQEGGDVYHPRNGLVRKFLEDLLDWFKTPNHRESNPELLTCLTSYIEARRSIRSARKLEDAARALWTLWSPLTNHGPPELFFLTRVAGRPHGQCFRFTGSDLSTYSLAQSGDGIGNVLAERCEDAEDWVHADKDHLFAIWTGRQDRLELRVATVIDRSDLQSPFSESSLGHWFYLLSGERTVLSALTAQEVGWRVVTGYSRPEVIDSMADPKKVFVVYGRNDRIKRAMFAFLRSIGLQPLEWSVVIDETGKGAPTIDEILKTGFDLATAAVVVLTGDDEARIRPDFLSDHDSQTEREYTPQPRQNVLYEAGMAMGRYPDQTVLVEIPPLRPFSDIGGIHTVRMDNSIAQRQSLANRLKRAGCAVELIGTSWHTEGDFSPAAQRTSSQ